MSTQIVIGYDNEFKAEEVRVRKSTPDKVLAELQGPGGKVIQTSLSHDDEAKLQAALDVAKI